MAEEKEPKADVKAAKKAKKTAVPEAPEPEQALPTAAEIRAAKKAELLTWTERYGLSQEGKVDDLRQRLRTFIEKQAAKEAAPKEEEPAPPKAEKKGKEKPKEKPKPSKEKKGKKEEAEEEAKEEVHEPRAKPKLEPRLKNFSPCDPRRTRRAPGSAARSGSATGSSETNGASPRAASRSSVAISAIAGTSRRSGIEARGRFAAFTRAGSRRSSCTTNDNSMAWTRRSRRCALPTRSAPASAS